MSTQIASPVPPDLRALLDSFKQEVMTQLNAHALGEVVTVDSVKLTCTVKIKALRQVGNAYLEYPLLTDCPFFVLTGGIGSVMMPVSPGDPCLVLFNDWDIDNWFTTGATAVPNTARTHSLSDGLVFTGSRNLAKPIPGFTMLGITLKHPGVYVQGNCSVSTGATGVFTSADGKTITVAAGVITNIT